jgi:hypothetical protein
LDHVIVLGEEHLRRILQNYAAYYNTTTERPRDRGVRASLSVASLGRMPGPYS